MADAKLSALTELAAAPAVTDEVYIRDESEAASDESKRITVANLLKGDLDDATSDPLIDADSAADGTEDSPARKDHVHPKHHAEAHTVASHSDTTGTGAELDELTDGSESTLHTHVIGLELPKGFSQIGAVTAKGSTTALGGWGLSEEAVTETDASSARIVSSEGVGLQQTTGTSAGNDAFWAMSLEPFTTQGNPIIQFKFALDITTLVALFGGLTSANDSAIDAETADPMNTVHGAGITFNTPGGDTNFMFSSIDGTTEEETDSDVAVDTAVHYVRITFTATTVVFQMFTAAGVAEGTQRTHSTRVPGSTTTLRAKAGIETQTTAARNLTTYEMKLGMA